MMFLFLLFRNENIDVAQRRVVKTSYMRHISQALEDNSKLEGEYVKAPVKYDTSNEKHRLQQTAAK